MREFRPRVFDLDDGTRVTVDARDLDENNMWLEIGPKGAELTPEDAERLRDALTSWLEFEDERVDCPVHPLGLGHDYAMTTCWACEEGTVTRKRARELEEMEAA